jgi:hypothetical protein
MRICNDSSPPTNEDFPQVVSFPWPGFFRQLLCALTLMMLVATSCSSRSTENEIAELREKINNLEAEPDVRPVATSPPAAPSPCDYATEDLIESLNVSLNAIDSNPITVNYDKMSENMNSLGQVLGVECGESGAGEALGEVLVYLSDEALVRLIPTAEFISGIIGGLCEPSVQTMLSELGVSLSVDGMRVCSSASGVVDLECRTDLKRVADNLSTADDGYFDRLFRESLRTCVNQATWLRYAPSSISTMLGAACILNPSEPVCEN